MSWKKKILDIFTYEDNLEETAEQKAIKDEIIKEQSKYEKETVERVKETAEINEPVKKQVLFVDETFEKKPTAKTPPKTTEVRREDAVKYSDREDKKFKPTNYISPVHGILKEAEEVVEYTHEQKTKSESDFVKIRTTAFGDDTQPVDVSKILEPKEVEVPEKSKVIFHTSEIVNINKRNQVDVNKNVDLTLEEAYRQASDYPGEDNEEHREPIELFELLDELEEESNE